MWNWLSRSIQRRGLCCRREAPQHQIMAYVARKRPRVHDGSEQSWRHHQCNTNVTTTGHGSTHSSCSWRRQATMRRRRKGACLCIHLRWFGLSTRARLHVSILRANSRCQIEDVPTPRSQAIFDSEMARSTVLRHAANARSIAEPALSLCHPALRLGTLCRRSRPPSRAQLCALAALFGIFHFPLSGWAMRVPAAAGRRDETVCCSS